MRPQQRWDEIWCTARQKLHGVTSSVSWSIVLLESEEVSCYGTNRWPKVLTEQGVTVISTINFYTRLNEHQFGSSKYRHCDRDHDRFWESGPSTQEKLSWYLPLLASKWGIHAIILNRHFPYSKLLFWSSIFKTAVAQKLCGEICNVYIGKTIIKAAKRIFNSDKICCYSDLNFGITFFGTQCRWSLMVNCQLVCLGQESAFLKNVVCDLDLTTHDLRNITSLQANGEKCLHKFWFKSLQQFRSDRVHKTSMAVDAWSWP